MRADIRQMPVLVDVPGNYLARDGKMVIVDEIKLSTTERATEFLVKGSVRIPKPMGGYKYKYSIWHVSGRQFTFGSSEHDIVGEW